MSMCFKQILSELSCTAYILSFSVKDEFANYIYQSSTLIELSQYIFSGDTSISNYEESILNFQCLSQRRANPCEWHPKCRQPQQNTCASGTSYGYLCVWKEVSTGPNPIALVACGYYFHNKGNKFMFCNTEFEGGCATLILIRQPLHCEHFGVCIRYVRIQLQCKM